MPTKVFISWSGPLSQKLGEALRNWLPSALQFVKPYFSPEDIEKGAKWGSEIIASMADAPDMYALLYIKSGRSSNAAQQQVE